MGHLVHPGGAGAALSDLACLMGAGRTARGHQVLSVPITRAQPQLRPLPHSFGWPARAHLLACMAGGKFATGGPRPHFPNCLIPMLALAAIQTILNKAEHWPGLFWHRALLGGVSLIPGATQPCLLQEAFRDCSGPPFFPFPSILYLFPGFKEGRKLTWLQLALNWGTFESIGGGIIFIWGC